MGIRKLHPGISGPQAIPQEPVETVHPDRTPLSGLNLDNLASTSELELLAKAFLVSMDILKRQQITMVNEKEELRRHIMKVLEDAIQKL